MPFDPSTAEPVTAVVDPPAEFDPASAEPVDNRHYGAGGSWKEQTAGDIASGAGKSLAEGAAVGGGSLLKGVAVSGATDATPGGIFNDTGRSNPLSRTGAEIPYTKTAAQKYEDVKNDPLYQLGDFVQKSAKEYYAKSQNENEGKVSHALNTVAESAGGFAPLVASGAAAPLTIALQTAGNEMEQLYASQIEKGATKERASEYAVNHAQASGVTQGLLFGLLPKPLQKLGNKYIVDKIAGGVLSQFLARRLAQAGEGAVLGAGSAVAGNVAAGRDVGEGVPASAAALALAQVAMPRAGPVRDNAKSEVAPAEPKAPADVALEKINAGILEQGRAPAVAEAAKTTFDPASAEPVPKESVVSQVQKMGPDEFFKWSHAQPEGQTGTSYSEGIAAIGDAKAIDALKEGRSSAETELKSAISDKRYDDASTLSSKVQFFNEAVMASEHTGSAAGDPRVDAAHKSFNEQKTAQELLTGDNFDKQWKAGGEIAGSENQIVIKDGRVYKRNYNAGLDKALPNHGTLESFNDNLSVHNEIFPETALKFEGMSETPDGPAPVVSQAEVKGVEATPQEVKDFMAAKGFEQYSGSAYVNKEAGLRVGDLKGDNVIKDANGVLHVIDPVIKRIKPEPAKIAEPAVAQVGLGAAAPAEFRPVSEFTTSARNAVMDAEAKARGQEPAMAQARQKMGETWDKAMAKIDENQNYPDELIAELKEKSRAIGAEEQAVLVHRNIELQNEFNKAERNIQEGRGTPDSLAADRATQERVLDELLDVRAVIKASGGSEVGRSLQFRKAAAAEDFSLATMLAEKRVSRGGAKLTPEEEAQVRKQNADIEEAQRALDQHEAQLELDDAIKTPEEATAQVTKLEAEVKAAEKAPKPAPKSKEEKSLEQFKRRTQKRIDEIRTRIEQGDFSKKPKRETHLDVDANKLQAELELAKEGFTRALEQDRYKNKSTVQKALFQAGNVADFIRSIVTTGEGSFIGRQGLTNLAGHPIRTARSIPDTVRALFADQATARAIDMKTRNDPFTEVAKEHGVFIDDPSTPLSKHEEAIASRWADRTWGIRHFNQSARVFLNRMRLESFKAMAEANPKISDKGMKAMASMANVGTGRGSLTKWGDQYALPLARLGMFSPRFVASRIQYTLGTPLWGGDLASRKIIAKEYARSLLGMAAFYSLYSMARRDDKDHPPVSFDPRSTNFGKIKLGKDTLDPLAGLSQAVVWESRNALTLADSFGIDTGGQSVNGKGKLVSLRHPAFGADDWGDMNVRFLRTKAAPIPGAVISGIKGSKVTGEPTTWANEAFGLVRPMTWWDLEQALGDHDVPEYSAIALMGLLGAGIQHEIERSPQKAKKQMGQPPPMLKK